MKWLSKKLSIVIVFLSLLGAWSLAARLSRPVEGQTLVLLPGPLAVLQDLYWLVATDTSLFFPPESEPRFLGILNRNSFVYDIFQSLQRISLGLFSAMVPAFILGIWFGVSPRVRAAATPMFAFAMYIPPTALVPILILWLGIGLIQQVVLLFIGTFFYLTVMVAATVAATPQAYREAALTLGARPRQVIWQVIIPNSLPEFIQHMRVMTGIAWTYLTVAEMVAAQDGVGRVIINAQRYLQTGKVLAGVLTIGLLGIVCDLLLRGASRLLCRWKA